MTNGSFTTIPKEKRQELIRRLGDLASGVANVAMFTRWLTNSVRLTDEQANEILEAVDYEDAPSKEALQDLILLLEGCN
ncbi:MAG: hypothetical protein NTY61_02130 [Candidatus Parcubacteria bacterium]|nr:hypothetical protein [Candidatus Parcubacteria bacterium]